MYSRGLVLVISSLDFEDPVILEARVLIISNFSLIIIIIIKVFIENTLNNRRV